MVGSLPLWWASRTATANSFDELSYINRTKSFRRMSFMMSRSAVLRSGSVIGGIESSRGRSKYRNTASLGDFGIGASGFSASSNRRRSSINASIPFTSLSAIGFVGWPASFIRPPFPRSPPTGSQW